MGYFDDIYGIVRKIPRGKVATYGSVASAAGHPGTARQVAWALRAPGAEKLPWHRVLGSSGKILLPEEAGLHQRTLLELEGVSFKGTRIDMNCCAFHFDSGRNKRAQPRLGRHRRRTKDYQSRITC